MSRDLKMFYRQNGFYDALHDELSKTCAIERLTLPINSQDLSSFTHEDRQKISAWSVDPKNALIMDYTAPNLLEKSGLKVGMRDGAELVFVETCVESDKSPQGTYRSMDAIISHAQTQQASGILFLLQSLHDHRFYSNQGSNSGIIAELQPIFDRAQMPVKFMDGYRQSFDDYFAAAGLDPQTTMLVGDRHAFNSSYRLPTPAKGFVAKHEGNLWRYHPAADTKLNSKFSGGYFLGLESVDVIARTVANIKSKVAELDKPRTW